MATDALAGRDAPPCIDTHAIFAEESIHAQWPQCIPDDRGVTPERMANILKAAGFRASHTEFNGSAALRSIARGAVFYIRFDRPLESARHFVDLKFVCPLAVAGDLTQAIADSWNRGHVFAPVARYRQLIHFSMDVLSADVLPDLYLHAQCDLWDGWMRDLLAHLRSKGTTPLLHTPLGPVAPLAKSA